MNKKGLFSRDNMITWLKQLKSEVNERYSILLVEGIRDKSLFVHLGFPKNKIIQLAFLSEERLLKAIMNTVCCDNIICIPLVDFDREGGKYMRKLKSLLELPLNKNGQKIKIRVDVYFRKKLSSILMGKYREIEDLSYYFEELQISPQDIY